MKFRFLVPLLCLFVLGCEPQAEGGPHVHDRVLAAVPIGSSFGDVTRYLYKNKVPYSVHGEAHTIQGMMNDKPQWESPRGNVKTRYSLRFQFDNTDHLTGLDVTEMHVAKSSGPPKSTSGGQPVGQPGQGSGDSSDEELPSSPHQ